MSAAKDGTIGLFCLVFGCTDVADDRGARDETVGHYRNDSIRIDVDAGLAVVREVSKNDIVLWSSAPAWTATVESSVARTLNIELRNVMPGSTLTATQGDDEALLVRLVAEPLPTCRRFVTSVPNAKVRLVLSPPNVASTVPYRFAVLGDVQGAITRIGDVYQRIREQPDIAFVLSPGDLTSQGTLKQLQRFETELDALPIPFYGTLGNHELGTDPPEYQGFFGRANLHFHHREAAFSLVDSASATLSLRTVEMLDDWLDEDSNRVHVFLTHYSPIDPIGVRNGSFASLVEAHQLVARLAKGRVDLSLHGHVHSFYEYTMAGIPSYITGGGGAIPERFDGIGRHFLVVEVGQERIEAVRVVRVD